jgi:hypothetical protein
MKVAAAAVVASFAFALVTAACGTTQASLYPARPEAGGGPPVADPPLQRPTLHIALTQDGLTQLMSALVPAEGSGAYSFMGEREYSWKREPFALKFDDARKAILAHTEVATHVDVPGSSLDLAMHVDADVQPVLSPDHKLVLQAVQVKVTSDDKRVQFAQWGAGITTAIEDALKKQLETLQIDFAPTLTALYNKLETPLFLPLGQANACFNLDVRGIEAGPSIFAGGFEKQLALVVAPSVTMPCTVGGVVVKEGDPLPKANLPALHNASAIEGGPFHLSIPIAAGYDELERAMSLAFEKGKLYFSADNPDLYLSDPHVYASDGALVASVKLGGRAKNIDVDGEIFLVGHPRVRDNFLEVPDIKPSIETEQALLQIAAAVKGDELTAAVRKALRLDMSQRLATLKSKLVNALTVDVPLAENVPPLCTRAELGRVEVTGIEAHDAYLRVYVDTTATAAAYLPCPAPAVAAAAP